MPLVRTVRRLRSGPSRQTWNQPSASVSSSKPPSASQRGPHSQAPRLSICVWAPLAMSRIDTVERQSLASRSVTRAMRWPSGAQATSATSMPVAVSGTASAGRGWLAGRPRCGSGASMSQTWLQPRRRERNAIRRPSGLQRGWLLPAGWALTSTWCEPSASMIHRARSRMNASRRPSADHCGSLTGLSEAVSWIVGPPRSDARNSCRAPPASWLKAT